jgi:hypothetical protein
MAKPADNRTLGDISADLARRWATQRLGAVQAYGRILADFGAGRSSSAAAAGAYARLVAEEGVRYPADALTLATDFATALVRKAGATVESGAPTVSPIQDLEMSGPVGGTASAEFLLKNPHDQPAPLSFVTSNFTGTMGDTAATVAIKPAKFTLAAGAEKLIKVSATIDPKAFKAGGSYTANVAVTGFDDLVLRVRLTVLPD